MNVVDAAEAHRAYVEALEDIEYLQCCDPLPVWREFIDVPATVIR